MSRSILYQGGAVQLDFRSYPGIDTANNVTTYYNLNYGINDNYSSPYQIKGNGSPIGNSNLANCSYNLLTIEGISLPAIRGETLIRYTYDETSAESRLESYLTSYIYSVNRAELHISMDDWTVSWYTDEACTASTSSANGADNSGGAPSYAGNYWLKVTYIGSQFTSGWTNTFYVKIDTFRPTEDDTGFDFSGASDDCFDKLYDGTRSLPEAGVRVFVRTLPSQPEIANNGDFYYESSSAGTEKTVSFKCASDSLRAGPGGSILLMPNQSFTVSRTGTAAYAWVNGTPIVKEDVYTSVLGKPEYNRRPHL